MEILSKAAVTRRGLDQDRYLTGSGHWSDWTDRTGMALTLIELEILDEIGLDATQTRRNIVTKGIRLESLIGKQFRIGNVHCIGIRPCLPCRYLEEQVRSNLRADLRGMRGGLRADVIRGGEIEVRDRIWKVNHEVLLASED